MIEGRRKGREESTEKEGRNGGRTELEGGRREKRDRIMEIYPTPCFPYAIQKNMIFTHVRFGEGGKKKRTFCTLVKMLIIMAVKN